tara:strand:- start:1826 stop:2014 length:189 start_codon:yes stop_codon:yes gene_type:complete
MKEKNDAYIMYEIFKTIGKSRDSMSLDKNKKNNNFLKKCYKPEKKIESGIIYLIKYYEKNIE